jgi:hypothetical protein
MLLTRFLGATPKIIVAKFTSKRKITKWRSSANKNYPQPKLPKKIYFWLAIKIIRSQNCLKNYTFGWQ